MRMSAVMTKFGGHVSVRWQLSTLRIDIVDSESVPMRSKAAKGKGKQPPFLIDTSFDTPAFVCDMFAVTLSMKDVVNFEKPLPKLKETASPAGGGVDGDSRRKSWHALKMMLNQLDERRATTRVNFGVDCRSITQHVNMSLLRLVHQFVTMVENIVKTKIELKGSGSAHINTAAGFQFSPYNAASPSVATPSDDLSWKHIGKMSSASGGPDVRADSKDSAMSNAASTGGVRIGGKVHMTSSSVADKKGHTRVPSTARPDHLPALSVKSTKKKAGCDRQSSSMKPNTPVTPTLDLGPDAVAIEMIADLSSPAVAEKTIVDEIRENTPKCWKTLYHLLDLYSSMPEAKAVSQSQLSVIEEEPERTSHTSPSSRLPSEMGAGVARSGVSHSATNIDSAERQPLLHPSPASTKTPIHSRPLSAGGIFTQSKS